MRDVHLRRRKLVRRAAIFVALALVAGTSVSVESLAGSGPVRPPVPWSNLPPRLRSLVHPTASQTPKFPGDSESMGDLHRWPPTWTVDGRAHYLRFRDTGPDGENTDALQDPSRLHPGYSHAAYYVPPDDDHFKSAQGPLFVWSSDGLLAGHSYKTSSSSEYWTNDEDGRLLFYSRTSSLPHPRSWLSCERKAQYFEGHRLREWYSENGELVSLETDEGPYWRGVRVPWKAMADSQRAWMRVRYPETKPRRID